MRLYKFGAHTKTDLKVHLVWIPKYRKRVLTGQVAIRARDVLRQIVLEHEIDIITGCQLRKYNDEMVQKYIEEQEGEPVTDDSRFPIDPS